MRLFFLLLICLAPVLAHADEVQGNLQVIAQRQADSESTAYLLLEEKSTRAWTSASRGPLTISRKPGRWLLSGIIKDEQEIIQAWKHATELSGGLPSLLVLDYSGGDTAAAMWLARQVQDNAISTQVPDWGSCLSSCAYVLAAGKTRTIGPWSIVGVHAQNSSTPITEQHLRDQATNSPDLRKALEGQPTGSGEDTVLPLSLILDVVDNVSRNTQLRDGQIAYLLARSEVSPFLLTYATRVPHTRSIAAVMVLHLPCVQALGLASPTGVTVTEPLGKIQSACGPLDF